jgi:dolichol-phosphate mannosyltransferase
MLLFDSVINASYAPLRYMVYLGMTTAVAGLLYAAFLIIRALVDKGAAPPEGWTSLMVAVVFIGGLQMMMLGIIGEYLWRAKESARRQALYIIEDAADRASSQVDK